MSHFFIRNALDVILNLLSNRWSEKDFGSGGQLVNVDAPLDEIPVFYLGSKNDIFSGSF